MKVQRNIINAWVLFVLIPGLNVNPVFASVTAAPNTPASIPWSKIGEKASADYKGEGLAVVATVNGARLHCAFQQIDGKVTENGLWLTSTLTNREQDLFQVKAVKIERAESSFAAAAFLPDLGTVKMSGQTVSFIRPGLTEEYSVSMDGVQQDFLVQEKPAGTGNLQVRLAVEGAKVVPMPYGARLILTRSGRELAYSRLRATDASGRELTAKIVARTQEELALDVDDAHAVYPVRIDPTFSDANWVVLNTGTLGMNGQINAMVADNEGNLYVGGNFDSAGGVPVFGIAKWNGSTWSPVGSTTNLLTPYSLAMDSAGNLYAGVYLSAIAGSSSTPYAVEKWNGSTWTVVGSYFNGIANALAVDHSGNVYAGGSFTSAGGVTAYFVAEWNGSTWESLDLGMNGYVNALAVDPAGNLYAGGIFTYAGGISANYIAKWNGITWAPLGSGMNGWVTTLATDSTGRLYAGGYFTEAGGTTNYFISQWNGAAWSPVGLGAVGRIQGMTVDSANNLYVCVSVNTNSYCAKWNGNAWYVYNSPLNEGAALAVDSAGNFYAGGQFTSAGSEPANYIVKWNSNGNEWARISPGINNAVNAVVVDSTGNLYVGGFFTWAGAGPANYVAKWNGNTWSALGPGLGSFVRALALDSAGNLYAGGAFTNAGSVIANGIAKWNGSTWSTLGSGMNNYVNALVTDSSGNLYAAGAFTTAGGVSVNLVAEWSSGAWSALGSGIPSIVGGEYPDTLALDNSGNLYAAGSFTFFEGANVINSMAEWNGSTWSGLTTNIQNGPISSMAFDKTGNLYIGGPFLMAGTNISPYVAEAVVSPSSRPLQLGNFSLINQQFQFTLTGPPASNAVIWASSNLVNWLPLETNSLPGGSLNFVDAPETNHPNRFYRASLQP